MCTFVFRRSLGTRLLPTLTTYPLSQARRRGEKEQWVYDVTSIRMYTYEHGRHGIPWRLSACANSVYQALFLPPPPWLRTRLFDNWTTTVVFLLWYSSFLSKHQTLVLRVLGFVYHICRNQKRQNKPSASRWWHLTSFVICCQRHIVRFHLVTCYLLLQCTTVELLIYTWLYNVHKNAIWPSLSS